MGTFEVNDGTGYAMNYEVHEGLVPQTTVFLHGNLASNRWWYPSLEAWKAKAKGKGYKGALIFSEFRGCGKSTAPSSVEQMNMHNLAKDLIGMVKHLQSNHKVSGPVNLVGHSTGGLIAGLCLSKEPGLFNRAVLLDPVGAKGVTFDDSMTAAFEAMKKDVKLVGDVMGGTIYKNDPSSDFFRQIVVPDAHHAVQTVGVWVLKALDGFDCRADMATAKHPVLVLHGEHDNLLPMQDSKDLAAMMKNAKFEVVGGQGHCTNAENPGKFTDIVDRFLFA